MLNQESFGPPKIANQGESHLACVLLLDTSGSMAGDPIIRLNQALRDFKDQLNMDELANKRVDIAIVEFNESVNIIQPFTPISQMTPVTLEAKGSTSMGAGINLAIDILKERNRFYATLGTPCHKPWIFMITDGEPTDDLDLAKKRIIEEEGKGSHGKLKFFALGVPGFKREVLIDLTRHQGENPRIMEIGDIDFSKIFDWLSKSMAYISVSRIGEEVQLSRLPDNVKKIDPHDTKGW